MRHAHRQRELIASLRLGPLFEFGELVAYDPDVEDRGGRTADIERSTAACRRAAANIETWRAYLPGNCVRAMIAAGWHWNT